MIQILQHTRMYHPIDYGADPTGKSDSTDALNQAIWDAFQSTVNGQLMEGITNLGGSELFLDGGTYKISRPLRLPEFGGGNFMVQLSPYNLFLCGDIYIYIYSKS